MLRNLSLGGIRRIEISIVCQAKPHSPCAIPEVGTHVCKSLYTVCMCWHQQSLKINFVMTNHCVRILQCTYVW